MKSFQQVLCLLSCAVVMLQGCQHPRALYEEPPLPPIEQGKAHEYRHQYANAEEQYRQIKDVATQNMTLNQLNSAWENVNASILRAQERVQSAPDSAQARLGLAQEYYQKGVLCTRYLKDAQGNYPRDFVANEREFFYTESLRQAKKALRLEKDMPEAYLLMSEVYVANDRPDLAARHLRRLITAHPQYARGYYAIGKIYLDTKQYDRTERYFIRTIKLDPDCIDAYYLLGRFYLDKQWYDYSAATFLEILRRRPNDVASFDALIQASHELGKFYIEDGHYDQAIVIFQEILRVKSSYPVHQSLLLAKQRKAEAAAAAEDARKKALEEKLIAQIAQPDVPLVAPAAEPTPDAAPAEPTPEAQETPAATPTPEIQAVQLRNAPAALANADILDMIKQRGFHHPNDLSTWGLSTPVKGAMRHGYEKQALGEVNIVKDHATGLMWQQGGSPDTLNWNQAKEYAAQLNQQSYAGFADWRMPTIEELASLLESEQKNSSLYVDAAFEPAQTSCWSADTVASQNSAWAVSFNNGHIYYDPLDRANYVRAVRTLP